MKLNQRISASWNLLTKGNPFPLQRKAKNVVMWPNWRDGEATWAMTDLTSYITEGFNLNAIIYSAIMYKVRTATSAPLMAYIGERDHREPAPPQSPLARLLARPNQHQSFPELDGQLTAYFNLFGNAYVWFKRDRATGYPSEMRALRPDRVRHLYDRNDLVGFAYVPEGMTIRDGTPLLIEDTMHVRLPNPGDPYAGLGKGLSPIAPLAQSGDVDNAATAFLKQFFDHGMMPAGLLSFDVPMQTEDVAEARRRWAEIYGGSEKWTDIAVMDQGGKYQRIGLTFDELDMESLDARNEGRMAMPFGVPLTLIESRPALVQSTYNNKAEDRVMFWEDVRLPELRMFEVEWQYYLHGDDGSFPAYDLSSIPALQPARAQRTLRILDAAKVGLATRAEYKESEGLPCEDGDNIYLVPMMMRPEPMDTRPVWLPEDDEEERANADDDDEQRDKALPALAKKKAKGLSDDEKQLVGKSIDTIAVAHEGAAAKAARKAFEVDRRNVRAIITSGFKSALAAKATIAWMNALTPINEYYATSSLDNWREQFAPVFEAVVMAQGKQLNSTYGMTFDVRNLYGEDWYRNYQMDFADPIAQTSKEEIRDLFSVAFREGASVPEMERSLDALFKQWVEGGTTDEERERTLFAEERLPPYRLENIARTETMGMSNAGANALYKDWGIENREWLATNDLRTRPEHSAVNGQIRAVGQAFDVGGYSLMYPGDPSGPPGQTVNCRCTILPVVPDD